MKPSHRAVMQHVTAIAVQAAFQAGQKAYLRKTTGIADCPYANPVRVEAWRRGFNFERERKPR